MKKIYKIMNIISIILIITFIISLIIDYYNYNPIVTSAPFYIYVIIRILEFLLPAAIILIICRIKQVKK